MKELSVSTIIHADFSHINIALDSLYSNTSIPFDLYLTINTGNASEVDQIRRAFPEAILLVNEQPRGFAANHNMVMRLAEAPYVALLNDDIFLHPHALDILVTYLREHPTVGLVGPAVYNPDGTSQLSVFSDPGLLRAIYKITGLSVLTKHGGIVRRTLQRMGLAQRIGIESLRTDLTTRPVPVVVGVAMVARREAYLDAGMMDEVAQFYGEEYGWHLRLRQHGWQVVFVPQARVDHFNRESVLTGWKLLEQRKATLAYFMLYRPAWEAILLRLSIVVSHVCATLFCLAWDRARADLHWQIVRMASQINTLETNNQCQAD